MEPNDNTLQVLNLIIKDLKILVTRQSIEGELKKHPDSASLLAISEILSHWNVPNAAYSVTVKELLETEIPMPFVACVKKDEFLLVNEITQKNVIISNGPLSHHVLTMEQFESIYQGTILAFKKDEASGDPDYSSKRKSEIIEHLRMPFIISGALLICIVHLLLNHSYLAAFDWQIGMLTLLKTSGLIASVFLLVQSIDSNNSLIRKVCGNDDNKHCNAILASKAAKITESLSWSEVGFFYFTGSCLVMFLNAGNSHLMQMLAILNLISLPYTFYSIFYQWRVAKQWCIFCCTIQAILWLEFFAFLSYLSNGIQLPALNQYGDFFIEMLMPVLLWVFVKPHLMNSEQLKSLKSELYRFKYNKELFQNMLHKEIRYTLLDEEDTITIGNKEANNVITLVSNPFCVHCSKTHAFLDGLVDIRDDLKLQLVFIGRKRERETDRRVMEHFISLESGENEIKVREAIDDWYKQDKKEYDLWKKKHPIDKIAADSKMLSKQKDWCNKVNITGTPTLFINGRRLPSAYQPEDIPYLL